MTGHAPLFTIVALARDGRREATRTRAASAMVLADCWAEEGLAEVRVIDPSGRARDRQGFRAQLRAMRRIECRPRHPVPLAITTRPGGPTPPAEDPAGAEAAAQTAAIAERVRAIGALGTYAALLRIAQAERSRAAGQVRPVPRWAQT